VAYAENRVMGHQNKLPWYLPADLKHFKAITLGKPVIMGRKTFESIGRPLPGRTNIVITRDATWQHPETLVAHSLGQALSLVQGQAEVFIIGGASVFSLAIPLADQIYLTKISESFIGDTYFPVLAHEEWEEVDRVDYAADAKNPYDYSFIVLRRRGKE
jgi:dihydrofolate reductase